MKNILSILLVIGLFFGCNSTEEDYQYVGWNDYDLNEGVLVNTKWEITMYCGTEYMITFQENDFTYKIIKDWNIIYEEYDSERVGSTYGPKKMKWEMVVEKEDIDHKVVEKEGIDYNATNSIH